MTSFSLCWIELVSIPDMKMLFVYKSVFFSFSFFQKQLVTIQQKVQQQIQETKKELKDLRQVMEALNVS